MQVVWTVIFAGLLICAAIQKPMKVLLFWPTLISHMGRGVLLILVTLPLMCANVWVIFCGILTITFAALNIWVGYDHPAVTLSMS